MKICLLKRFAQLVAPILLSGIANLVFANTISPIFFQYSYRSHLTEHSDNCLIQLETNVDQFSKGDLFPIGNIHKTEGTNDFYLENLSVWSEGDGEIVDEFLFIENIPVKINGSTELKTYQCVLTESGQVYLKSVDLSSAVDDVYSIQVSLIEQNIYSISSQSNKFKGNFGEIGSDVYLTNRGYIPKHNRITSLNALGHHNVDGVFFKDGNYFIVEAKYHGTATLNSANPATNLPKQMSDAWISQNNFERLRNAVGNEISDEIIDAGFIKLLAEVSPDGSVKYWQIVDSEANELVEIIP